MLIRALIVVLLALNLGVALWWSLHPPAPAARPMLTAALSGPVARLQLVGEMPAAAPAGTALPPAPAGTMLATAAADTAFAPTPGGDTPLAPPLAAAQCVSLGPFVDASSAAQAQQRLHAPTIRTSVRAAQTGPARGWHVLLPAYPDLAEAEAAMQRIAAAGFTDYFLVRQGSAANSIALGRFGAEATARRHAATLVAAGFPARAEPLRSGPTQWWLDVTAAADFDAEHARTLVAAAEHHPQDCTPAP